MIDRWLYPGVIWGSSILQTEGLTFYDNNSTSIKGSSYRTWGGGWGWRGESLRGSVRSQWVHLSRDLPTFQA